MTRPRVTKSGRFEIHRPRPDRCIELRHLPTGLPSGRFSHIAVRTLKAALQGVEEAEARLSLMQWQSIDTMDAEAGPSDFATSQALGAWQAELRRAFPNGAWGR